MILFVIMTPHERNVNDFTSRPNRKCRAGRISFRAHLNSPKSAEMNMKISYCSLMIAYKCERFSSCQNSHSLLLWPRGILPPSSPLRLLLLLQAKQTVQVFEAAIVMEIHDNSAHASIERKTGLWLFLLYIYIERIYKRIIGHSHGRVDHNSSLGFPFSAFRW